ncbi:nitronate monooxygenase [Roseateles sp. YR242]|uniref:NAD(P)H-dependent flavin oxidoreductase n=1 Tax=Roseateles sp. YR242 TaxID=1855305 RepID=UPI0008AB6604|nr:nitronate monooxygenase [Roseateles sp. YR242]SEL85120.1 nitronate monooxygenase [Roseateles sp. YR242]
MTTSLSPLDFAADVLSTHLPLIQAPMAGVQAAGLAIAVSEAGGLGSLPAALLPLDALQRELEALRAGTHRPFNVNFFAHVSPLPDPAREARWRERLAPYFSEFGVDASSIVAGVGRQPFSHAVADVVEAFKPPVISFHFGLPAPDLLARVKGWGSRVISSATTVEEAVWLEAHGVDAVIAQGWEAGGHRGHFLSTDLTRQAGTLALLPQIVNAVSVPVIATGGIVTAAGIQAALALGASAVQVGTAFMLCEEALTSAPHRQVLREPQGHHTAVTNLMTGRPARGIVNRLMREVGPINELAPAFPLAGNALAPLRAKAEAQGSGDFSPLWAGQNFTGLKEVGAAALVAELAQAF